MTQPGAYQHQRGVPIRKRTDYPRPAPDLPVHSLNDIVGPDLHPMLGGKVTVGQGFFNAIRYLDKDEQELKDLTDSAISKLNGITDAEFRKLDLIPDFDY